MTLWHGTDDAISSPAAMRQFFAGRTVGERTFQSAGSLLMSAPELSGTANGTTIDGPNLVGQLGTRDSSSVPWMLLIAANFAVTVGALVFLRLRR